MYTNDIPESTDQLKLLGYTVFSILDKHLEISFADLRAAVTPLGFGSDELLPPEPEPRTYIRRAITAWLKEIASDGTGLPVELLDEDPETGRVKKPLIREIKTGDSSILILAFVRENIDLAALGLEYMTNLRVFYIKPKKSKEQADQPGKLVLTLTPSGATDPATYQPDNREAALLAALQKHVDYYSQIYRTEELRRMVRKIIESMNASNLRPDGGVYFVPYGFQGEGRTSLLRLKKVVEEALPVPQGKNSSILMHLPVVDEASSKAQVAGSAHAAFMQKCQAFEEGMKRFLTDPESKKRGIRKDLMQRRMDEMDAVMQELDLYNKLLGVQRDEIDARLNLLKEQGQELIGLYAIGVKRERETERKKAEANPKPQVEEEEDEDE